MWAKVNALRELQSRKGMIPRRGAMSASGEELRRFVGRTLMSSVLDKAFKGEL
jgi:hypothetical protein